MPVGLFTDPQLFQMEKYSIEKDIKVLCATAMSFPDCIQEAFDSLVNILPMIEGRNYYGLAYQGVSGKIIYKAAAEQLSDNEEKISGFESFVINKGEFLAETVMDWRKHLNQIGPIFMKLVKDPRVDRDYPCLEWYKNDNEMMCLVRLAK